MSTVPVTIGGVSHAVRGAQVVVFKEGRVLLQLRPWPPGWELPGGHVDPGEALAVCAAREVREETGFEVEIGGLVGVYRWQGLKHRADAVFWAEITGGTPRRSIEQVAVRFFRPERLPRTVFPWIPQRVHDAVACRDGAATVVRDQPVRVRHVLFFGSTWIAHLVDLARRRIRRSRRATR